MHTLLEIKIVFLKEAAIKNQIEKDKKRKHQMWTVDRELS